MYSSLTLAQARSQREPRGRPSPMGETPGVVKQGERCAAQRASPRETRSRPSPRDWHVTQTTCWNEVYVGKVPALLEDDVFAIMGGTPIADIKAPAILDLLRSVEARGICATTKRILQRMRAVFQYGVIYLLWGRNPAADIAMSRRTRSLSMVEARARCWTDSDFSAAALSFIFYSPSGRTG